MPSRLPWHLHVRVAGRKLVEHLRGKTVPKLTISPMTVITKANVSEATPWEPTKESIQKTLELDLGSLRHEFASGVGY